MSNRVKAFFDHPKHGTARTVVAVIALIIVCASFVGLMFGYVANRWIRPSFPETSNAEVFAIAFAGIVAFVLLLTLGELKAIWFTHLAVWLARMGLLITLFVQIWVVLRELQNEQFGGISPMLNAIGSALAIALLAEVVAILASLYKRTWQGWPKS